MNKIFYSPIIENVNVPGIFLAGPIQGAPDWQKEAIKIISALDPEVAIFNPRKDYLDGTFDYEKQVDWETYFLRSAGKNGVVLFWLAKETEHNCERAYAQTTRFELAEWKMRHERDGANIVIGIEEGFTGARYIKRRIPQDCPDIPLLDSLEAACKKAVELIH